jgi:uncharacterized metal-binding protein YceD (DUF177 family)
MLSSLSFHKDFSALRFSTHDIGVVGVSLKQSISAEAISALIFEPHNQDFTWVAQKPAELHLEIERENDHCFKVHVQATLVLNNTCVRCLKPVSKPFCLDFLIRMMEKKHLGLDDNYDSLAEGGSIEIDISKDDEDLVGYFSGTCIDLGIILRDQIFLEVPDYPQCDGAECSLPLSGIKGLNALDRDDERGNNPFVKLLKKT